ncbi:flagellar export protein FliJ [Caballeronia sp. LZ062]|uniref:flagellar export protein FliJ n=1 Tax=unclassified Caballeronia TaxID=2646786 RepID=UPI002860F69A|nr:MULTISPECIES: flagellar export protein FliJ [unclassified Caballeronia]MDR5855823.1 flagellar export protein FliJ [Caballeronia sp. LZ050]MDR5872391.1 flagellar export protein FliJ [Caballeronia sp. LZ062]
MSKNLPIHTLIELAQEELDAATKKLGKLQQERNEIEKQLDSLITYRDEYHARFTASAQQGTTAQTLRNFQAFVDTLDSAIAQQRALLVTADHRIEAAKPEWRLKKQKVGSYEVLAARGEAVLARKAARVEQREADEHAAKVLRMRAERA